MTSLKIIKSLVITIFLTGLLIPFLTVQAATLSEGEEIKFSPNVTIPGSEFKVGEQILVDKPGKPNLLIRYVQAIYKFFVGIAGVIAVFMIVFGGVTWLFSGGSPEKIGRAKEIIVGSMIGLLLAVGSYTILYNINPSLVQFQLSVREVPGFTLPAYWCDDVKLAYDLEQAEFIGLDGSKASQKATACGKEYYMPGKPIQQKNPFTCHGRVCSDENQTCGYYFTGDGMETKCMQGEQACENIDDGKAEDYGMSEHQSSCDSVAIDPAVGVCLWINYGSPFESDGCKFYDIQELAGLCETIESCEDYAKFGFPLMPGAADPYREAFCTNDPCGVTPKGKKCKWSPGFTAVSKDKCIPQ